MHIIIFIILSISLFAQSSGPDFRRTALLNGNSIQTTITNNGVIAQPRNVGPGLSWKSPINNYAGDLSIMLGVELPIKNNNQNINSVIVTNVNRPGGGDFSSSGKFWGFEPVEGYYNSENESGTAGFALSTNPETWPQVWSDHPEYGSNVWNGLYGADTFVGDKEALFVIDDANDEKFFEQYGFLPNPSDPNKKGLGITIKVRYVQINEKPWKDVLFRIYEITNSSVYNYEKVTFGNLTGTYIGIDDPEYNDDLSLYYPNENLIIHSDFDNIINNYSNSWKGSVGMFGETFIGSNNKIESYSYFTPAGNITLSNDEDLWSRLKPGTLDYPISIISYDENNIPIAIRGEDGDCLFGTDYFSLNSGETKVIASIVVFGYSKDEIFVKTKYAEALYNSNFNRETAIQNTVITSQQSYELYSDNINIAWESDEGTSADIYYSADAGSTYKLIAENLLATDNYTWNIFDEKETPFGKLIVVVKQNGKPISLTESGYFGINNNEESSPLIKIINKDNFDFDTIITDDEIELEVIAADNEQNSLSLDISYNTGRDEVYFHYITKEINSSTEIQNLKIDVKQIPNSERLSIKLELRDNNSFSSDQTLLFQKFTVRDNLNNNSLEILSGFAEIPYEVRIADSTRLNGHQFLITFNDTSSYPNKLISIFDETANKSVLKDYPIVNGIETPVFYGLTFYSEDEPIKMDTINSQWNNTDNEIVFNMYLQNFSPSLNIRNYAVPYDYKIVFYNGIVDTSSALPGVPQIQKIPINYRVFNTTKGTQIKTASTGFSAKPRIWFIENEKNKEIITYTVDFLNYTSALHDGDTLYLSTVKGLSRYDSLRVSNLPTLTSIKSEKPVDSYSLSQNFPNPFNPTTTIKYTVVSNNIVQLRVYDILGREVKTLVNEQQSPGKYSVSFNADNLSSGVYIYRLQVNNFITSRKMMLLK